MFSIINNNLKLLLLVSVIRKFVIILYAFFINYIFSKFFLSKLN